ncbi:CTP synthase [Mariniplasma anaerobium]|uniref:CTP synthase n=1 Tax=Mariniplasma anaerobium TaxID=2735436 RepID=A0A7U9XWX3_9MOLU|nr:CTP synthase [Mariniplasma anaerobium]BCR36849.1 CTP synthase [Mariniplasma anaerobium]
MTKYIFVTGGVVSSLGKGITASAIGQLLKSRGLKVFMQKFDPYINVDPGTMSPLQHGEVFVTDDGAETDLDLGHYERFIDENLNRHSSITTGKIYQSVLKRERRGDYLGATVQVIPHITDQIKKKLKDVAKHTKPDIVITEIGGTVGDIESLPFLEAIRQARRDFGYNNTLYIHNTLVPYLKAANEIKTKPTQHSVKELMSLGIHPDMIVLRSEKKIDQAVKNKIAMFCDVDEASVFESRDVDVLYEVITEMYEQKIDSQILEHFQINNKKQADVSAWYELIDRIKHLEGSVNIALVGKYVKLHDAYLSVSESLKHAGYFHKIKVNIKWVDAEKVNKLNIESAVKDCQGILVPGGFGARATEGKLAAITYAREHNIPFFGICYGMQLAVVEYAKNVLNILDANSTEIDPDTKDPVISLQRGRLSDEDLGGTLRLGLYECELKQGSKAFKAYDKNIIKERHRHRYEFNNAYLDVFEQSDMIISGFNGKHHLVEMIELKDHPWFIAVQFHPEFLSRPLRPHPLFRDFIEATINHN